MPRSPRIVLPGIPHHISQRGNNRQDIFFTHSDRELYLSMLKRFSVKNNLSILAYCLMTNHIHIIAIPSSKKSMSETIGRTHMMYAQIINAFNDRCGHLWHERFHSSPFDEEHSISLFKYVEMNPVRAGLIKSAFDYHWSSARAHVNGFDRTGILEMDWWLDKFDCESWKKQLICSFETAETEYIRERTYRNQVIGNPYK